MRRTLAFLIGVGSGVIGIAGVALSAEDLVTLAASKGCMACHDINARKLGPAFKDVAKRYSLENRDTLTDRILNGSSGAWGNVPMPANTKLGVSESDARKLAGWILSDM